MAGAPGKYDQAHQVVPVKQDPAQFLWRGDLSPLGCAAAPKRSIWHTEVPGFRAASRPDGDKSPRHRVLYRIDVPL
ncbi:hypothetical protein EGM97_10720 [Pseudomonas sp. AF32]|nr:hypothetical protein [Pseudomonas sp. AF32]